MKFENTKVYNLARAVYSARNPLESWEKSDSDIENDVLGPNDLALAQKLIKAGCEHRKFLRQVFITTDITAPLFWWKETDQYKIGIVTNSCSTMHKLASTPITLNCFEMDDFGEEIISTKVGDYTLSSAWNSLIAECEFLRQKYNETKNKRYWKELIRLLPESWLQKRTITMNYENVLSMIHQRKGHKLTEWSKSFIDWAKTLPYAKELLFPGEEK